VVSAQIGLRESKNIPKIPAELQEKILKEAFPEKTDH
jgi:hypothetical protein